MAIITEITKTLVHEIGQLDLREQIDALNAVRLALHTAGPFSNEPVDLVQWVLNGDVRANDYNPNSVAPPEMELLRLSIANDGYTQPIVTYQGGGEIEVVDGFHRNRVGKECKDITARVHGYLPTVKIRPSQEGLNDRIASTIRHNRARGKHTVDAMSDIVLELKRRNWTNKKIGSELGMDEDEVLRLCQITGLMEVFADHEFSKAWDVDGEISDDDFEELTSFVSDDVAKEIGARTINTSDTDRVFHTFDKWECYKAGFYSTTPPDGVSKLQCKETYRELLTDIPRFEAALSGVIRDWVKSCEHYLTNTAMNRIAWLGQASLCYDAGISSEFRSGFGLLSNDEKLVANSTALKYLNIWLFENGLPELSPDEAETSRQTDIY